jgi:fructosamine-3-kinase
MKDWQEIGAHIAQSTGQNFIAGDAREVGGGCINQAYVLRGGRAEYFVKINRADSLEMFAAEAEGLAEIAKTGAIRVPRPICWGVSGQRAYLAMEYLALGGGADAIPRLGEQLAVLHRATQARFGWHRDNTIGATPQPNAYEYDWLTFLRQHRLGFQFDLAARRGGSRLARLGERLLAELGGFFQGYTPAPSLLHGDLWSGNYAIDRQNRPVIFDPAVYYGDREADLAMTELFGGFPAAFYAAYQAAWPLDSGYRARKTLYNLYHIVNHYNLFGGGYLGQAERMCESLLSELGVRA